MIIVALLGVISDILIQKVFFFFYNFLKRWKKKKFLKCVKILHSNSKGDLSTEFQDFLTHHNVIYQWVCPHTPEQHGISKQNNHHILKTVCMLVTDSVVPSCFWVAAISTLVYIINKQCSSKFHHEPLYFHLFPNYPNYDSLHTFGWVLSSSSTIAYQTYPHPSKLKCVCFLAMAIIKKNLFVIWSYNQQDFISWKCLLCGAQALLWYREKKI